MMEYRTEQHKKEGFHHFRRSQSISVVQAWQLETPRHMLEECIALTFTLQQTGKWRRQVGSGYHLHRFTPTDSLLLTRLHLLQCVQSSEGLPQAADQAFKM